MTTKESWIIIRRATGEAVFETTNPNTIELVDHNKACVMTAQSWNRAVRLSMELTAAASKGK